MSEDCIHLSIVECVTCIVFGMYEYVYVCVFFQVIFTSSVCQGNFKFNKKTEQNMVYSS